MLKSLRCGLAAALLVLAGPVMAGEVSEERLRFLMEWDALVLGVPTKDVDLPRIVYTSQRNIMIEFYGPETVAKAERVPNLSLLMVRAVYHPDTRAMILNEEVDYTDPENEYILVHELVHHLQVEHDLIADLPCPEKREVDAYRVQDLWVQATGLGERMDPLTLFLVTTCRSVQAH